MAVQDPAEQLRAALGDEPPPAVRDLDEATLAQLTELVAEARREQARSLEEAFAATVKQVPFPVRGVVRKMLFG